MGKEAKLIIIQLIVVFIVIFMILPMLDDEEVVSIPEPYQKQLNYNAANTFIHNGRKSEVTIEKLAEYKISAVVKGKRYYLFDVPSEVSPMDLILVWGKMDTEEMDKYINYSQSGRWYYFSYDCGSCVDGDYLRKNSANVHIIPKNLEVLKKLIQVRKEDYITLKGYLVLVHFTENEWKSSLSRKDTGNGACEIMYVENVTVIKQ